jgi:hypothetical protein
MEKINYILTLEDCNNYAKSQSKIPRLKRYSDKQFFKICSKYIIFLIIFAFISFSFSIYNISTHNHLTLFSILTNNGFPHFLMSQTKFYSLWIISFLFIFFIVFNFQKHFSGGKMLYKMLSGIDLNYEISISEENLTRTNKNGISVFNWETTKYIYDTKYNYLIFTSDLQAIIIPKRCFENEERGKDFYNNIQKYYNAVQKR